MLKIHETTTATGALSPVFVRIDDGALVLVTGSGAYPLPEGALDAVMARYGKPLEDGVELMDIAALEVVAGKTLWHVRHLARFDVIARDYLVYGCAGAEALCALATTVAGALEHLALATVTPY
ncbi:MAG TPA: hypothetical protein VH044_17585 [Polyangiaceae bacterium]|jgi:hypothetical protein|nr:hypothetical protein [Polyangiaceae bacterium]